MKCEHPHCNISDNSRGISNLEVLGRSVVAITVFVDFFTYSLILGVQLTLAMFHYTFTLGLH